MLGTLELCTLRVLASVCGCVVAVLIYARYNGYYGLWYSASVFGYGAGLGAKECGIRFWCFLGAHDSYGEYFWTIVAVGVKVE